jgi:hypothetical protein
MLGTGLRRTELLERSDWIELRCWGVSTGGVGGKALAGGAEETAAIAYDLYAFLLAQVFGWRCAKSAVSP